MSTEKITEAQITTMKLQGIALKQEALHNLTCDEAAALIATKDEEMDRYERVIFIVNGEEHKAYLEWPKDPYNGKTYSLYYGHPVFDLRRKEK